MDLFLRFESQPDGSMQLSMRATASLVSLLSDARMRSKRVSIALICAENQSILLRLREHPTMRMDWHSTLSPRELHLQPLEPSGRLGAASGEDAIGIQSTSEFGKGE